MNDNLFSSKKFEKVVIGLLGMITVFFIFEIISIAKSYVTGDPTAPVNTITLSGTGKVFAVADVANFSFTVDETANTVADAQKLATDKNNKAIDYLKKQSIDEKDIQAVLTGVNGATALRSILASLDTKKQALLLGHAIAMPVVVQTREYDEKFYRAMGDMITTKQIDEFVSELF